MTAILGLVRRCAFLLPLLAVAALPRLANAAPGGQPCLPEPTIMDIAYGDLIVCEVNPVGDSDTFRFSGVAGETVFLSVARQTGAGDPCVRLVQPGATPGNFTCVTNGGQTAVVVEARLTQTGVSTVQVMDGGSNQVLGYALLLERLGPPGPGAAALDLGRPRDGEIDLVGDSELYSFDGTAGQTFTIVAARTAGPGDPCVRLIPPEGPVPGFSCFTNGGQTAVGLDVKLTQSGTHSVQVTDGGFNQTLRFALALERLSPPPPTAIPIGSGQTLDGDLPSIGFTRIYSFLGASGDSVTISVARRGGGDPCVRLIDPAGGIGPYRCFTNAGQTTVSIDARLTQSGTYTFQVADGSHNQTLVYRVDLQCFGACPANPAPPPADCIYRLSPTGQVFPSGAATGSVGILTGRGCPWTASTDASFLTLTSGATGTGPGTVRYALTANTAAPSRTATLRVADQSAAIAQAGTAPLFLVTPNPLTFSFREGGPALPDTLLSVFSSTRLNFTATAQTTAGGPWLTVNPASGASPASVIVSVDPARLPPGDYQGTIAVTAPGANPALQTVPVALRIEAAGGARLAVDADPLTFAFTQRSAPRVERRVVANLGTGSLAFQASAVTESGGDWLRVSPDSGSATLSAPVSLAIRADPTGLAAGTYNGRIRVTAAGVNQSRDVPVTMTVSSVQQSILLSQTGLTFTAVARGAGVPGQTFGVLNAGQGVMSWSVSASTLSGGSSWLSVGPTLGTTDAASLVVPLVDVNINAGGLDPGEYYGLIEVSSAAADNSPQLVSVVLNVLPQGSDPGPIVRPTGLIFTGLAGGIAPATQQVLLANISATAKTFTSGRLTVDGTLWFAVQPASGSVNPDQPVRLVVQPDIAGLSPGIRRGVLTLLLDDGTVRNVNLLLVLIPGPPAASRPADGCAPTRLLPVFTLLGDRFSVPAAWPNPLDVRVVDDCGQPMTGGSVTATFSNGDPSVSLVPLKDGRWSATWQPRNVRSPEVSISVSAEIPETGIRGSAQINGALLANISPPVVAPGGVAPVIAPGGIVSIYGTRLADAVETGQMLPLPTRLGGATVTVAGRFLPLYFASDGQINGQVPYDLAVNTRYQLVIRRGSAYTVPEGVTMAPAQPAVFTRDQTGQGQGLAFVSGALADTATPARPGDVLVIYCSGLGPVAPALTAGFPAPASPLARTTEPVSVLVGGVPAQVAFAGLAPGFSGLYQVNAVLPESAPRGDAIELILKVAGQTSPPVTISVR